MSNKLKKDDLAYKIWHFKMWLLNKLNQIMERAENRPIKEERAKE